MNSPEDSTTILRLKRDYQEFMRSFEGPNREDDRRAKVFGGDSARTQLSFSAATLDLEETCDFQLPKSSHFEAITQEWKKPKSNDFDRLNKEVRHIQDLTKVTTLEQRVLSLENELKEKTALMENAKRQVVEDKMLLEARIANLEMNLQKSAYRETEAMRKWNETASKQAFEAKTSAWKIQRATDASSADNTQLAEFRATAEKQIRELRSELLSVKSQLSSYMSDYQTAQCQIKCLTETNQQLSDEIQDWIEKHSAMERNFLDTQRNFDLFKDEFKMAQTMQEEMRELKSLRTENFTLKQNCQKYKNLSENTWLLKEANAKLTEELSHLRKTHENSLIELAELKSVLAHMSDDPNDSSLMDISHSEPTSPSAGNSSYNAVDKLSRKNAVLVASEKSLTVQLRAANERIESLTEEMKQRLSDGDEKHQQELQDLADGLHSHYLKEIEILTQNLEEKQNELDSLQSELNRVVNDLNTAETALDEALTNYHEAQAHIEQLMNKEKTDAAVGTDIPYDEDSLKDSENVNQLRLDIANKESLIIDLKKQLCEKDDYNPETTQIIHMSSNPLSEAHEAYLKDCRQLQQENEQLKIRLAEWEKLRGTAGPSVSKVEIEEDADVTGMVNARMEEIKLVKEIDELKAKIKMQDEQRNKLQQINATVTRQFREVSSELTGYQIKMKDNNIYQVQSLYDREAERHFIFQKATTGEIQLLENDYVKSYSDFVESYLGSDHSIPAFLSAVTLQLYNKNSTCTSSNFDSSVAGHSHLS